MSGKLPDVLWPAGRPSTLVPRPPRCVRLAPSRRRQWRPPSVPTSRPAPRSRHGKSWALDVERRAGHNVAAVALANKLARVAWRVWRDDRPFEHRRAA